MELDDLLVGVSIDPSITAYGYGIWYGPVLVEGGYFPYETAGSQIVRCIRIAQAFSRYVAHYWTTRLDWLAVEGQIHRDGTKARAISVLQQAADTAITTLSGEFSVPAYNIWNPLPETWKGAQSKQATELLLCGDLVGRPGLLTRQEINAIAHRECFIPFNQRNKAERKRASDVFDGVAIGHKYVSNQGIRPRGFARQESP